MIFPPPTIKGTLYTFLKPLPEVFTRICTTSYLLFKIDFLPSFIFYFIVIPKGKKLWLVAIFDFYSLIRLLFWDWTNPHVMSLQCRHLVDLLLYWCWLLLKIANVNNFLSIIMIMIDYLFWSLGRLPRFQNQGLAGMVFCGTLFDWWKIEDEDNIHKCISSQWSEVRVMAEGILIVDVFKPWLLVSKLHVIVRWQWLSFMIQEWGSSCRADDARSKLIKDHGLLSWNGPEWAWWDVLGWLNHVVGPAHFKLGCGRATSLHSSGAISHNDTVQGSPHNPRKNFSGWNPDLGCSMIFK